MSGNPTQNFPNAAYSLPDDIVNPTAQYSKWILEDTADLIEAAMSSDSPYSGESDLVPSSDDYMGSASTGETQFELNALKTAIDNYNVNDYETLLSMVVEDVFNDNTFPSVTGDVNAVHSNELSAISTLIDTALEKAGDAIDATPIQNLIDTFERSIKKEYLKAVSELAVNMSDIGAIGTSSFMFGLAILNREYLAQISAYANTVHTDLFKDYIGIFVNAFAETFKAHLSIVQQEFGYKHMMVANIPQALLTLKLDKLKEHGVYARLQKDANAVRFTAKVQEQNNRVAYDVHDAFFDFEALTYGFNFLGAAHGAVMQQPKMSPGLGALSGALTGAATGNEIVPGGIGAGIGAVVGAVTGYASA